jgi:hypothetical protein
MLSVANKPFILSVVMLNVVILSVVMLNVIMLSVVMLSVVILNVVMLNVVAPRWHQEKRSSLLRQKGFMTFGNKEKK